jgi:cytochrome c6
MKPLIVLVGAVVACVASSSAWSANPARGRDLYNMHCSACHGPRGEGVAKDAPKFKFGERLEKPDILLMQTVKTGKKGCPPQFGVLQDNDILDILSYVRMLR